MQKYIWWDVERILMENATDDPHRMGSKDINHRVSSKFLKIICADNRVVVSAPDIIYARFRIRSRLVDETDPLPPNPCDRQSD
jgi:hypothetical protein